MICVKRDHPKCADSDIFNLETFYNSAQSAIHGELASSGSERRELMRRPFIGHLTQNPSNWKQNIAEMETRLDSKIKAGLKAFQESVLRLQSQAIRENNHVQSMGLKDIDYIKKKCHIKVDREGRRLELKFRQSNKIREYLVLSRFLYLFFAKRFAASRAQLMRFRAPQNDISIQGFHQSPFLTASFSAPSRCLKITAKKNSVWQNEKGRFNQCLLLSKPIQSALFEVHVRNLSFKSTNLELLIMNQQSYDFWKKRVKLGTGEDFTDVPSLARVDFDLRRSHPIANFTREKRELRSMEMSIRGCRRLVERVSVMCAVDQHEQSVRISGLDTRPLANFDLSSKSQPKTAENKDVIEAPVEIQVETDANTEDDEWEDISDESAEPTNTEEKFPEGLKTEMTKCVEGQSLFVALVLHNEHVQVTMRFHDFVEQKS